MYRKFSYCLLILIPVLLLVGAGSGLCGTHPLVERFGAQAVQDVEAAFAQSGLSDPDHAVYFVRLPRDLDDLDDLDREQFPAIAELIVLAHDGDELLVSGPTAACQQLAVAGCRLVQIRPQELQQVLAPQRQPAAASPRPRARTADPAIQALVDQVAWPGLEAKIGWLQNTFPTRYSYGPYIADVADSLAGRFADLGLAVEFHEFSMNSTTQRNVIATQLGATYPDSIFVICAHYDDVSEDAYNYAPGADDNGSGTAAVLTAAELFAPLSFDYTIKYIGFAAEEQGLVGSEHWVDWARAESLLIVGALNFDMIGWWTEGVDFDLEIETNHDSLWLANAITDAADLYTDMPYELHVNDAAWWGDHYPFWVNGYAAVNHEESYDWFDPDFNPHYHSTSDLLQYLDPDFAVGCTRIGIAALATLARLQPVTAVTEGDVADGGVPARQSAALAVYPNPFNPRTTVSFSLDRASTLKLSVLDLAGRQVAVLAAGEYAAGEHAVSWDGKNAVGSAMPSGTYLVRLETAAVTVTHKANLVR